MSDTPFSISPNPNCLYVTPSLKGVLHKARFTIEKRQGLSCILGDFGLGKSTVLRFLHGEYSARDDISCTLLPTPNFPSLYAMMKSICLDFGLRPRRSLQDQQEELQEYLIKQYEEGRNVILFIDEAQLLDNKALELVRAILNFETHTHKLIQIVLAGQLELKGRLQQDKNKALYSRISTYSLLDPLTPQETADMIQFRCRYLDVTNPFTVEVTERIYELTGGIPRNILKVCALAYEMMLMSGDTLVPAEFVEAVPEEVAVTQ